MNNKTQRYFSGIRKETDICKIFQSYLEKRTGNKTFFKKREKSNASIDFLGRVYDSKTNDTIKEIAIEVRTLFYNKEELNKINNGFIYFPISKLNEIMLFLRLKKEVYILYRLGGEKGKIYFINFDYYLNHNFEIKKILIKKEKGFNKEQYVILIPIRNLILIDNFK